MTRSISATGTGAAGDEEPSVLDEIADVVVRIGPQGTLTYVNRAWQELTGKSVTDMIGLDPLANVHPDDRAVAVRHMAEALAGQPGRREVRFLTSDGGVRWMEVRGRALFDADGAAAGFSGVLHDVTDRREAEARVRAARDEAEGAREEAERARAEAEYARDEAERARAEAERAREEAERAREEAEQARDEAELARDSAERASRAKSEFLSRISHELRTPLNAILGFSQLLEFGDLTGADADNLTMITRAGRHLLNLINELMDVSRIESGRLAISLEPVDVSEAVAESLSLIRPAAEAKRVTLRSPGAGCAGYVTADRQRLIQVLVNLLSNAVKYNRDGGRVRVDWHHLPDHHPASTGRPARLRIEVSDTGTGIPVDRLDDVFLPFERLGAHLTGIEGTGIGLAITKSLVEAMDGRIGVRSAPGAGSTFHIDLPLRPGPAHPAPTAGVAEPVPRATTGPAHTVLYIEDNPSNVLLMERIFSRRPAIRLLTAGDAPTGLATAHRYHPDLILLDLHLPGCEDGGQVVAALRTDEDPRLRDVPVVMVTADLTAGTERRLRAAGADAFLPKPVDIRTLLGTVDRHLGGAPVDAGTPTQ